MTGRRIHTREELLAAIETAWERLQAGLAQLTAEQMTRFRDKHGWTIIDHLVHLAAWERSVVTVLRGRPRHEGLGIDEVLYRQGTEDEINAVIQAAHGNLPPAEALAELRAGHRELLALLAPLSDADLRRPYRDFLSEEAGNGDDRMAIDLIYANTAHHFGEHLAWIETLAQGEGLGESDRSLT